MSETSCAEVGRFAFGTNGKVILSKSDTPLTYYKVNWLLWAWVACAAKDKKGCAALEKAALSLDRPPPPLRGQPAPPPAPVPPPKTREQLQAERDQKFVENVLKVGAALHDWWTRPTPPLFPPRQSGPFPPLAPAPAELVIPAFDIQDIPNVMDKTSRPVSAKMMRHWFAGQSNYSLKPEDATIGTDHNGQPFPRSMIDQTIIKLDWVLGFARAKEKYDELVRKSIYEAKAEKLVHDGLRRFFRNGWPAVLKCADALAECGGDIHRLHPSFQFQFAPVDEGWSPKVALYLKDKLGIAMAPDDLTGALGSFSIYAAIGDFMMNRDGAATVKSIYVYVRDSYSFLDTGDKKDLLARVSDALGASQYLGHWNQNGVYLAPLPLQGDSTALRAISAPLVDIDKSIYDRGTVMYPVTNKSFRDWRDKHGRGGDFIAYSDVKKVWIRPIKVQL